MKSLSSCSSVEDRHISSSREPPLLPNPRAAASQALPRQQSQTYKRNPGVPCQGCLRPKHHIQVRVWKSMALSRVWDWQVWKFLPYQAGLLQNVVYVGRGAVPEAWEGFRLTQQKRLSWGGTNSSAANLAVNKNTGEVSPFPRIQGGSWLWSVLCRVFPLLKSPFSCWFY